MKFLLKFRTILPLFALLFTLNIVVPAATPFVPTAHAALDTSMYDPSQDNILQQKVEKIVKIVASVGGTAFVLAILIISLFIIFGSISPRESGTYWKALFSCLAGAFVFFSAYAFAPQISHLAFN
jgi:hypothetical protein